MRPTVKTCQVLCISEDVVTYKSGRGAEYVLGGALDYNSNTLQDRDEKQEQLVTCTLDNDLERQAASQEADKVDRVANGAGIGGEGALAVWTDCIAKLIQPGRQRLHGTKDGGISDGQLYSLNRGRLAQ